MDEHAFTEEETIILRNMWRRLGENVIKSRGSITMALCEKEAIMPLPMMKHLARVLLLRFSEVPDFLKDTIYDFDEDRKEAFKRERDLTKEARKRERESAREAKLAYILGNSSAPVTGTMTPAKLLRKVCLEHGEIGQTIYKEYILGLYKIGRVKK